MAEDRRDERYQKEQTSLNTAITTGALIGGGILAFRNRRALGQGLKRLGDSALNQVGRGYTSAASSLLTNSHLGDTLGRYKRFGLALSDGLGKQTGVFRATRNAINPQGTQFASRFNASVERQLLHKAQKASDPVHQNSTGMSQWYFKEIHTRKQQRSGEAFKLAQHDKIQEAIQNKMADKHKDMLYQLLVNHEKKNRTNLFNSPTTDKVADFVQANTGRNAEKNNMSLSFYGEEEAKAFVNKLTNILTHHSNPKAAGMKGQKATISKYEENIKKIEEDAFRRAFSVDKNKSVQSELLTRGGYRQITFGDYRKFNLQIDNTRVPVQGGKHKESNMMDEIQRQYGSKMDLEKLIVDKNMYINDTGEMIDMRGHNKGVHESLSFMQDSFQVPFLRFNFLDLAHFSTIRAVKDSSRIHMMGAGETYGFVQHKLSTFTRPVDKMNATSVGRPTARGGYMYAEGNMYDIKSGQLLDENLYLGPENFGPLGRMHDSMMNLRRKEEPKRGLLKSVFDIGAQQQESFWSSTKSAVTKLVDPLYAPNLQHSIAQTRHLPKEERSSQLKEYYGRMYRTMHSNAMELSPETINHLSPQINDAYFKAGMNIDVRDLVRDKEVMDALGEIVQKTQKSGNPHVFYSSKGTQEADGIVAEIHDFWNRYRNDPSGTIKSRDMEPDKSIALPDHIAPMQLHEPNLIAASERARRLIHQYSINQMEMGTTETGMARRLAYEGKLAGVLTNNDVKQVRQLETLNSVRNFHNGIYSGSREVEERALNEFSSAVTENQQLAVDVQMTTREFEPWYAAAPKETKGNVTGSNTQIYRKHKSYRTKLAEINEQYKAQGKTGDISYTVSKHGEAIWDTMREIFAGRKNAHEVTTLTAFPFYYAERMDNAVAGLGGGLSQTYRGSAASIIGNQFLRRVAMPYMAYQQAVWLDGQFNDVFSDTAADMYVNMHSDLADVKEFTGVNRVMRSWSRVFSGADQIAESPFVKPLDFLSFGAFSDWRSGDDVRKYYESGEDEVRKNRYWGIGSGSPWAGTGVEYYQPNWYRTMKSDYKFTDTMYGSESEYWANNWMPTLTHPFAPINHFFLDPYHYENKHKDDRPYAVTGGFSEIEQIPLIGPALDGTVGRILKPRQEHAGLEKAHRKYIEEINANIKAKYGELEDGHFVRRGVAGGVTILEAPSMRTADSASSESEQRINELMGDDGGDDGVGGGGGSGFASSGMASVGNGGMQVGGSGTISGGGAFNSSSSNIIGMSSLAQMDLTARNTLLASGTTGAPALTIDRYAKMLDPNIVVDSSKIGITDSPSGLLRDAFYSASEVGGIYGFMTKTAIGFEESGRGTTWAPSSLMTSYSRSFWDMNLGGLGGQISEIGRRYLPRDPNKHYYSPIENTMPDWLPGTEYFMDFQHGDPYTKIKKGEMRLPGKSYETLYELHPDGTGQGEWADYGIFDRFRILADVAPYSNQYKQAKSMVSQMNQQGLLSEGMIDEYEEVRDQVAQRKKKYRWYNKRFLNADVKEETVHVTQVLDQNTFLTKEHGSNPIRLAGVKLSKDDAEAVDWLSQFIKQGATLRIGVDGDPNNRINRDTMNTMSAVVYAPEGEEGGPFSYSIKGQSLNYILANRKWSDGSKVRVHDNESSTATYALFSNDMRAVGRQWERLTHDILPQLPIVGVFADKFLQVRTPIESYERDQVYGKEWKPWTEPINSWLVPMAETITSRNPLVAAAEGAGIGHLMTKAKMHGRGRIVGAAIGGLMATARVFYEKADALIGDDRSAWIPKRREKEREINEYFDRLKYVKYKGLYEKARRIAEKKEGVDVEKFFDDARDRGDKNKGLRKYIAEKKKWLSIAKKSGYGDNAAVDAELEKMATSIGTVEEDFTLSHAGPYATLAMQYRKEYEGTLYGIDPKTSDMRDVLKAMTPKEREYFPEFLKANNAKDRNRLLNIVPEDMRRILQAKWGMKIDKKENIVDYFRNHNLPNENWDGWSPNTSLDGIKIKVMKNHGVEPTEAGFWQDDEQRADLSGAQAIPLTSLSSRLDVGRLEEVLRGAGLSDVRVTMNIGQSNGSNQINTALNILKDIKHDVTRELNNNIHNIFST